MKTKLLFIAVTAFGLSSCSITDDITDSDDKQLSPVNFANGRVIGSTKAIDKATTWDGNEIVGIFATKTTGAIGATDFNANFTNNLTLTNGSTGNTNGSWTPGSTLYWPANADDRITFFAYHPYAADVANGMAVVNQGSISILHTVKANPGEQTDLLWAWINNAHKRDMDGDISGTNTSSVPFAFKHALTKVSFSASTNIPSSDATVTITALTITAQSVSTSETNITGNLSWGAANTPVTFPIVAPGDIGSFTVQASGPINNFTSDDHELLMIPQLHFNSGNRIDITYTISYAHGAVVTEDDFYILADTETGKWNQNAHIRYNFNLVGEKINFSTSIVGWDPIAK